MFPTPALSPPSSFRLLSHSQCLTQAGAVSLVFCPALQCRSRFICRKNCCSVICRSPLIIHPLSFQTKSNAPFETKVSLSPSLLFRNISWVPCHLSAQTSCFLQNHCPPSGIKFGYSVPSFKAKNPRSPLSRFVSSHTHTYSFLPKVQEPASLIHPFLTVVQNSPYALTS